MILRSPPTRDEKKVGGSEGVVNLGMTNDVVVANVENGIVVVAPPLGIENSVTKL